ncbi:hypothetical protein FGM00_08915 [Aggregatimonas sangjinii]|uniref:Uncharacterized protein n=1 Tax=Aggregatimonas sangjinii TaxID=2583587 RepID=A0A5B7SU27_9FLAO|nr:hypothetical protein [Aggregatimonas sangjinii]QCX00224.1 hypothetical protein FGM00_08915 [Aggregatimonas sangjinii]
MIIKSKVVRQAFDLNVPLDMVDVVTGSKSLLEPKEIVGFDELIAVLGVPDAIKLSFNADANFAIGIASSFDIVGFMKGEDTGKIFAYAPVGGGGPISFTSGFGASFSVEAGLVFDNGSLDDFNKGIFEGKEASLSGSYGPLGASVFVGIPEFGLLPPLSRIHSW